MDAIPTQYTVRDNARQGQEPSRNRRLTHCLSTQQARNLLAAFDHATAIGHPLNTHVTVHWAATQDMAARIPDRIQLLIERMRHWLNRRGILVCHVWVQEASARRFENKDVPHLHMLVHVPGLWRPAFDAMLPEWVGGLGADNAVHVERVLQAQAWRWREYLGKGVNPRTRDNELQRLSRHKKSADARGPVEGKRSGCSQNTLGPAARARWQHQGQQSLAA